MPNIDLSILNQRATPAFFADTLANRPAPSFVGRIFISTDTLDLYRDTGSAWLLLSPSSTGTITGSGAAGQVTYFSGTSSITGNNNLFYDTALSHLGINTNTPGSALDVHDDQSTLVQLNQTNATNDTRIGFQNNGTALWRIGNFYNAGANDWGIFDVVGAAQPFTIKKTTGQTFIGAETTSSGRLVVNNSSGDNHIVVIGATAPSIRINNAGSGATRQIGIGLATAVNNFIQGAAGGEMAIFNSNTTASPILFGIYDAGLGNTQEAARFSAARNFLIGTTTDAGFKLDVNGIARVNGNITTANLQLSATTLFGAGNVGLSNRSADSTLYLQMAANGFNITDNSLNTKLSIANTGNTTIFSTLSGGQNIRMQTSIAAGRNYIQMANGSGDMGYIGYGGADSKFYINNQLNDDMIFLTNGTERLRITSAGNVGIGTTSPVSMGNTTTLHVGNGSTAGFIGLNNRGAGFTPPSAFDGLLMGSAYDVTYIYANNFATSTWRDMYLLSLNTIFQTNGTERMRITSGGNLLIGTTTDNGAKLQVNGTANINGTIIGDNFLSVSGAVSNPFAVWTTMFTIPANQICMYQLIAVSAGNGLTYTASALIVVNSAGIELRNYVPGGALTLQISGYDVQVQNGSGSTLSINYKYIKIG